MADVVSEPLSFQDLFREHAPFVWRVLRHLGVAETELEDGCQEVFVAVHRKLPEFEGRSSVPTWLYGFCLRVASHARRTAHRRRYETTDEKPPEQVLAPDQHDALERRRLRASLRRALDGLDAPKRSVFILHELEELPMSEVAEALGCPLQTAYSRLHAARRRVADALTRGREP